MKYPPCDVCGKDAILDLRVESGTQELQTKKRVKMVAIFTVEGKSPGKMSNFCDNCIIALVESFSRKLSVGEPIHGRTEAGVS